MSIAAGWIVEQTVLCCVSLACLCVLVVQLVMERWYPERKVGGLKLSFHRLGLFMAVLLIFRDVDPRGVNRVWDMQARTLFAENTTAALIALICSAVYFWIRPSFLLANMSMPRWLLPSLVMFSVLTLVFANVVFLSTLITHGTVPYYVESAWMFYLAVSFVTMTMSTNYVIHQLRQSLRRLLDPVLYSAQFANEPAAYTTPPGGRKSTLTRTEEKRIEGKVREMVVLQAIAITLAFSAAAVQIFVGVACAKGRSSCAAHSHYSTPDAAHYEFNSPAAFLWFQHVALIVCAAYAHVPWSYRPERTSTILEESTEEGAYDSQPYARMDDS